MSLSWCYDLSNRTVYGFDSENGLSPLQDRVALLLKDDRIPEPVVEQIMHLIDDVEIRRT